LSLDGTKQRQKLRSKICTEKEKLEKMVATYNELNDSIKLQYVENGNFPWKTEISNGDC